jgi:hypothetical protein
VCKCVNLEGKGFILDAYNCTCKNGYYRNTENSNSNNSYTCLKCSDGCETCTSKIKHLDKVNEKTSKK